MELMNQGRRNEGSGLKRRSEKQIPRSEARLTLSACSELSGGSRDLYIETSLQALDCNYPSHLYLKMLCSRPAKVSGPNKKARRQSTPHNPTGETTPTSSGATSNLHMTRPSISPLTRDISRVSSLVTSYLHLTGTDHQFCSKPRYHKNRLSLRVSQYQPIDQLLSHHHHLISSSSHLRGPSTSNQPQTMGANRPSPTEFRQLINPQFYFPTAELSLPYVRRRVALVSVSHQLERGIIERA